MFVAQQIERGGGYAGLGSKGHAQAPSLQKLNLLLARISCTGGINGSGEQLEGVLDLDMPLIRPGAVHAMFKTLERDCKYANKGLYVGDDHTQDVCSVMLVNGPQRNMLKIETHTASRHW
jgi:hypothetical protein